MFPDVFYIQIMWLGFIKSRYGCFVNSYSCEIDLEKRLKLNVHPILRYFCSVKWTLRNDLK